MPMRREPHGTQGGLIMPARPKVLVAGGGVAALEALLALHDLVGRRVHLELLAPGTQFLNRPASVAERFGLGGPAPVTFAGVTAHCGATLHTGTLAAVRPEASVVVTADEHELDYDTLVVAVGGRAAEALRSAGARDVQLTLVASENAPLWLFGEPASDALSTLLRERGIALVHGRPAAIANGQLVLERGELIPADRTIVLPPLQGPWIEGLAHDDHGFIPVDPHGRVSGAPGVFAAGDATSFPIKQGGLATQQADVVATTLAADLGAVDAAAPFRPVLRGLLLTGGAPLYLRAELTAKGAVQRTGHARRAP